ncbi:hypothetical protein BH10PLA2_BH10PLA2_37310 [soil metagenome]
MHKSAFWRFSSVILGAALIVATGCGKQGKVWEFNNQVEGIVKLEGKPVANVLVQFVPVDPVEQGPISTAQTDAKGHFHLMTQDEREGAVLGKHKILVSAGRNENGSRAGPVIPSRYRTTKDTVGLEVTADRHSYDVDLKR